MWTVGAIAFQGQFETRVNRTAELRFGLRRERCDGVRAEQYGRVVTLGAGERKDDSAGGNVYMVSGRFRAMLKLGMNICKLGMYICALTIATMRQHADKEHSEQEPKIPR